MDWQLWLALYTAGIVTLLALVMVLVLTVGWWSVAGETIQREERLRKLGREARDR